MSPNTDASPLSSISTVQPLRSRRGCQTCRDNKVECDEQGPRCRRCTRLDRLCDYTVRPRKKYTRRTNTPPHHVASTISPRASYQDPVSDRSAVSEIPTEETLRLCSPASVPISPPNLHGIALSEYDYEAIHYVHFTLALRVDTSLPEYSRPALMWTLSQKSPMVLHMVCALGSLQICHNSSPASDTPRRKFEAATHYGVGLRLLDTAIQDLKRMSDLDFILATLWLMISYELAHGGGTGARLSVHLRSAALLLRGRLGNLRAMIDRAAPSRGISRSGDSQFHIDEDEQGGITCLTSQLLVWISLVDGSAASNGIDATFNDLIGEAMLDLAENEALSRLMGFSMLQRYATMVYLEVWDSDYPQSELIEDLQCSQIFCLQAEAGQLRYMLSKLANGIQSHQPTPIFDIDSLARAISDVEDLLTAASILELPKEGPQRRYVLNLRTIVPFYYGIVLLYYSLFTPSSGSDTRQRSALREIMTLAFRAHSDEGEKAMYQIAWPFVYCRSRIRRSPSSSLGNGAL